MTGVLRPLEGHDPLPLTDPDRLWRVAVGAADLFLVRFGGGRPRGPRHPLWRVESGGCLPPFPVLDGDWTVLAVGTPGTQLAASDWQDPDAGGAVVAQARAWLADAPGLDGRSDSSEPAEPGPGEPAPAVTDPPRAATARLLGQALRRHLAELERDESGYRRRVQRREEADRGLVGEALSGLVRVLGMPRDVAAPPARDPLLAACRKVGEWLRVEMQRPAAATAAGAATDGGEPPGGLWGIEEIALASHLRSRRVALEGRWWRSDAGPLVAFVGEDGSPVALLPRRGGYRAFDPASGTERKVDAAYAAGLAREAVTFYRALPHRPVGARDLLRFGGFGLGRDLWTLVAVGLAGGLLALLPPIVLGKLVDTVIPGAERGQLLQLVGVLVAAALGAALFNVVRAVAMLRIESHMDAAVQAALWDRILDLPLPFFKRFNAGDLARRALGINAIRQVISGSTVTTLLVGLFSLLNVGLMVSYSPRLALVGIGLALAMVLVALGCGYLELCYQREVSDLGGRLSGKVLQLIKAVAKLRGAGAERRAFAYWADDFARQRQLVYKARLAHAALVSATSAAPVLSSLVLFAVYAASLGGSGEISSGSFLAFVAAFAAFSTASLHAGSTFVDVLRTLPLYERARPILESVPEAAAQKTDAGALRGDIEVARVSFRYQEDGPDVLVDVSLRARPGESIAVVGPSGAGKSTLLRLLLGFEQPTTGAVYYDAQSLADLDPSSVRRQVGVVLQSGQLLGGDILGNIVGALPLGIEEAWEAARMAGLADDIRAMPMGMHTLVSEGGVTLSGGQRQRLMIARALVQRPRLVFFDEATSALDNPTQALVAESLERLRATRLLIAHRLSTIRHADRIFVLQAGRITESGSYEELMDAGGAFAELARRQIA